jgi:hypothetical protein
MRIGKAFGLQYEREEQGRHTSEERPASEGGPYKSGGRCHSGGSPPSGGLRPRKWRKIDFSEGLWQAH